MAELRIDTAQRRARLAWRHRLAPAARPDDDVAAIADSVVALHSSDPVTVYLSAAARMRTPALNPTETALYQEHSVIRHHAMRRTLWVMTPDVLRVAHAAATRGLIRPEWNRIARLLESSGVAADGDRWLAAAKTDTLAALTRLGEANTRRLGAEVPELTRPLHMAVGTSYAASPAAHTRVLLLLGFDGAIVRGRPAGTWINGQYSWTPMASVLPGGVGELDPAIARADLTRRWLSAFGPATTEDLRWWLGSTLSATRAALRTVGAVQVQVDGGDGWILPEDAAPVTAPEPWVALLPGLDPTTMGWKDRTWYLGGHGEQVFDRNGNGGPTIWADGRIVGAWAQRKDGSIATRVFESLPRDRLAAIKTAVGDLEELLGPTRFTTRFPSPIQPALLAPPE